MADLKPVLDVQGLTVRLPPGADRVNAVENVSFSVAPGEIVCVVGESGSGKSVTAHTIMGLLPPGQLTATGGRVLLEGDDVLIKSPSDLRRMRLIAAEGYLKQLSSSVKLDDKKEDKKNVALYFLSLLASTKPPETRRMSALILTYLAKNRGWTEQEATELARAIISSLLAEGDFKTRRFETRALGAIGQAAIPPLLDALSTSQQRSEDRLDIIRALGELKAVRLALPTMTPRPWPGSCR